MASIFSVKSECEAEEKESHLRQELAFESERKVVALQKIRGHFLDDLAVERILLKAFKVCPSSSSSHHHLLFFLPPPPLLTTSSSSHRHLLFLSSPLPLSGTLISCTVCGDSLGDMCLPSGLSTFQDT